MECVWSRVGWDYGASGWGMYIGRVVCIHMRWVVYIHTRRVCRGPVESWDVVSVLDSQTQSFDVSR